MFLVVIILIAIDIGQQLIANILNAINQLSTLISESNASIDGDGIVLLINGCKAKDRKAQKKLYELFAPIHYAKIRRYVSDTNNVDDILNESFYKILTKIDSYSFEGPFEAWMHRVTINTVMDFLRKKIKSQEHFYSTNDEPELPIPETIISKLAYKELLALVHSLPDAQRSVFNLFVFENCSHKEIASLLDINENNSRWHLNDARRRLKEKLDALL